MGNVKRKRMHYKQSGEGTTAWHMREREREREREDTGDWWRREGQHTFCKWTLVIHIGAGKKGRRKVGYHSGSWLLEIAVQMPSLSTYLFPSVPLHRYI